MPFRPLARSVAATLVASLLSVAASAQFAEATYQLQLDDCAGMASVCSEYPLGSTSTYDFFVDGVAVTGPEVGCEVDTTVVFPLTTLSGNGFNGPFDVVSWSVDGQAITGSFNDAFELEAIAQAADPAGLWRFDLVNIRLVADGAPGEFTDLVVYAQADAAQQTATRSYELNGGSLSFAFAEGSHLVEAYEAGVLHDAAAVEVTCDRAPTYSYVGVYVGQAAIVCPDLGALAGPVDAWTTTPTPAYVTLTEDGNGCFTVGGLGVGVDTVALRYCDAIGTCATADYIFDVDLSMPINASTVYDTVAVGAGVVTYCIDTLELPGTIVDVADACPGASGTYVSFDLTEQTACLKYRGVTSPGTDTSCVVVCDDLGFCDTTIVIVTTTGATTYPEVELFRTVEVGTRVSEILDVSALAADVRSVSNACPGESGRYVDFTTEDRPASINYAGLAVGTEVACLDVEDEAGGVQRFTVTVTAIERAALRDTVRMRRGDRRRWCLTDYRLAGTPIEIYDRCASPASRATFLPLVGETTCGELVGEAVGTQVLCMRVCDNDGACDETELFVEVVPTDDDRLPRANDDYFVISPDEPGEVDPLLNDVSATPFGSLRVISPPDRGTAAPTPGLTLAYELAPDPCAETALVYEVCNEFGCDQATATLAYDCAGAASPPAVVNRSGFSPNGDGVNETWVVTNIEFYPDSEVHVFNRWGTEVFSERRYGNDWTGTYADKRLPDGTYFVLIDLGTGADPIEGYVHIRR